MPPKTKKDWVDPITFEDARIVFRNFAGNETAYNPPGRRNFCVLLDPETADVLRKDGWNVRELEAREEGDVPQPYMQVTVSYKRRPPKVVLISPSANGKQTYLDEDSLQILDWADIHSVDMIVTPYNWDINGKSGIKAYLKKMFVILEEDELERKYALGAHALSYDDDIDPPDEHS